MVSSDWMVLLMEEIVHQLRLVVYPIIYRVLYIPGGWPWDFWTINSMNIKGGYKLGITNFWLWVGVKELPESYWGWDVPGPSTYHHRVATWLCEGWSRNLPEWITISYGSMVNLGNTHFTVDGGWTNPFEKHIVKLDHFAKDRGEKKTCLKPATSSTYGYITHHYSFPLHFYDFIFRLKFSLHKSTDGPPALSLCQWSGWGYLSGPEKNGGCPKTLGIEREKTTFQICYNG